MLDARGIMGLVVPVLVYLNNYFHDLATAFFFVTTLFAWWTRDHQPPLRQDVIRNLKRLALISFVLILVLGQVRAVFYREYEWLPALGRKQLPILIGKHVVLVAITAWAGFAWLRLRRLSADRAGRSGAAGGDATPS